MVEKNLSNPEYSIEDLSRDMCMSRATLYRKITSITGSSPSDFVKNVRLRKAAELLKEGGLSIAEIADKVGFNTPSYFTKSFKKLFWGIAYTNINKLITALSFYFATFVPYLATCERFVSKSVFYFYNL